MSLEIDVLPTPNPNALKFILGRTVKAEGKSIYKQTSDCVENPLAEKLFSIRGIDNLIFFDNVITITKFGFEDWEDVETKVMSNLRDNIDSNNPNYIEPDHEEERRK